MSALVLPHRQGDYAVYENPRVGVRFHIETTGLKTLYGVENVTEGFSLRPRTKEEVARLIAKHGLVFVEFGR
jgi:hypothetical protein